MDSALTASDVALLNNNEGWGGNSFMWIFALLILANGGFGGWGRNDYGQFASAASQQEILFGQQFQGLDNKIDRIGNGIADAAYALNEKANTVQTVLGGQINTEGRGLQNQLSECCCTTQRNIDSVKFDMANYFAKSDAHATELYSKLHDEIAQNKIEALQGRINQLELQANLCGVVRYPNAMTYTAGTSPFCNCNCGNYNI
jgi:hypothetical protein